MVRAVGGLKLEPFEARTVSGALLDDYVVYRDQCRLEARPEDPPVRVETVAATLRNLPRHVHESGWILRGPHQEVVGEALGVTQDIPEYRHLFQVGLGVLEGYRRRGLGTELLGLLVERAEALGKSLMVGVTNDRVPAGAAFCEVLGASRALEVHTNRLVLAEVDHRLVQRWIDDAFRHAPGYCLIGFDGPCPEGLVESLVDLLVVMNDAPRGALAVADHHLTVEEFRDQERLIMATGEEPWWLIARHDASGTLVGLTTVSWDPSRPQTVRQGVTSVRSDHRGQSIGRWLKAAMLKRILEERTEAVDVRTGNADSNAAILAINTELGFRQFMGTTNWQIGLAELKACLDFSPSTHNRLLRSAEPGTSSS